MQVPPQYSRDRLWWWDGYQWRPVGMVAPPATDMFWFFGARDWAGPIVLMALVNLVPIAGGMALYGWVLEARDNLRRGWPVVPPASFSYLERGVWVWLVIIPYTLVILVAPIPLVVGALVDLAAGGPPAVAIVLGVVAGLLLIGLWIIVYLYLLASLFSVTDRYGIGAGFNPARAWRVAAANGSVTWKVAGAFLLGTVIIYALLFIPYIGFILWALTFLAAPVPYLMAAYYLARFDETKAR